MNEILVDFNGLTVKLDVNAPITTSLLEEFLKDYYGTGGEIVLLYRPNPWGSRHYCYGGRPELTIGGRETSGNVSINGVPKILQSNPKAQKGVEMLENRESLGKRKRIHESAMPPNTKRVRRYSSAAVGKPTITGEAIEAARLSVSSAAQSATSYAAHQSSATAGLHSEVTRGAAFSGRGTCYSKHTGSDVYGRKHATGSDQHWSYEKLAFEGGMDRNGLTGLKHLHRILEFRIMSARPA